MSASAYNNFQRLLQMRWSEAASSVGIRPDCIRFTWDIGPYDHFKKPRGYAVAISNGDGSYHLRFAEKTLQAPVHRADGLIRHELGHVLDFLFPADQLNRWAKSRGVHLPPTPERRADAIALAVWHEPILYDQDTVQSTRIGQHPRPEHLGL